MPYLFLKDDLEKLRAKRENVNEKYRLAGQEAGEACGQGAETWHDNAAFDMAMGELHLQGQRLGEIDAILRDAQIVSVPQSNQMSSIGHKINARDKATNHEIWYLLGSYVITDSSDEEALQNGSRENPYRVSYISPIGSKLNNRRLNETFQLQLGSRHIKIFEIVEIC